MGVRVGREGGRAFVRTPATSCCVTVATATAFAVR